MRIFITYFLLEYKRSIKVLSKSLLSFFIMILFIGAGVLIISHFLLEAQVFKAIDVGVVIPEDENEAKMIFKLVSSAESFKSISKFHYLDSSEAMEGLKNGELQAVIELPENFYEDINNGINTPADIYFSDNPSMSTELFKELLASAVSMVRTSEANVYSIMLTSKTYPAKKAMGYLGEDAADIYGKLVLERGRIFDKYVNSPFGRVDLYQYYICAAVSAFLIMFGLNCGFLYKKHSDGVEQKLKIYSLGGAKLCLIKISVMASLLWLMGIILYILGCIASDKLGFNLLHFDFLVFIWFIPLSISIAAYFNFVYIIAGSGTQGAALLLAVNALMIICSGSFFPLAYLPDFVSRFGVYLPLNLWNSYSSDMFFASVPIVTLLKISVFTIAEIIIGAVIYWKNFSFGTHCS